MQGARTQILYNYAETRFLIATRKSFTWLEALEESLETVTLVSTSQDCMSILIKADFDLILYVDGTFDLSIDEVVTNLKLQAPAATVAIMCEELSAEQYEAYIQLGVADVIRISADVDMMVQRISALIRQKQTQQELSNHTRQLHAINLLSQELHKSDHPTGLIEDSIELIGEYFNAPGVVIALVQGEQMHLYAGSSGARNADGLYESFGSMRHNSPFQQVITSQISMIFDDIKKHPNFFTIPVLENVSSTVIVPIKNGSRTIGALALFGHKERRYTSADVALFELLGISLGTAYANAAHYYSQKVDAQSMRYVLNAWQRLNGAFTRQEIIQTLYGYLQEIDVVEVAGIWLFRQIDADDFIFSGQPILRGAIQEIVQNKKQSEVLSAFEQGLEPIILDKNDVLSSSLQDLLEKIDGEQANVIPIASNSFDGLIFISGNRDNGTNDIDISLIENLARVTATLVERITLIESIAAERQKLEEQTGRIEGVLRSIDEGIFFVNDDHRVVYCNPQFSELTTISPSQVLTEHYGTLLKLLATRSPEHNLVLGQLQDAADKVQEEIADDAYPIVEIALPGDMTLLVEFMRVAVESDHHGWIGVIVTQKQHSSQLSSTYNERIIAMLEDMSVPLLELSKTTMMLPDQYDMLSAPHFASALGRLDKSVQQVQSMWNNLVQIYRGEVEGLKIRSNTVNPVEFIKDLLTTRRMSLYRREIGVETNTTQAQVDIDERHMRRCFINLIEFMVYASHDGAPIFVNVNQESDKLVFNIQEKTTILTGSELNSLLRHTHEVMDERMYPHRLGLYHAKQIVEAHRGDLTVTSNRGLGIVATIRLPIVQGTELTSVPEDSISVPKQRSKGLTMVILESSSQFLHGLYPDIWSSGHETIQEQQFDSVLYDLKMARVDLILLEVDHGNSGLLTYVQKIRSQSEVPIVIVSAPEFEDECLQSLASGADDYFIVPFNEEKLLAQLYSISKRQELAARTSKPIEVGDLTIDFSRRRVHLKGKPVNLTTKEYDLLRVLVMNRGQVLSHRRLLAEVWGPEYGDETQYLWVNISRLRRKLEPTKGSPRYIQNEPRVGYIFVSEQ